MEFTEAIQISASLIFWASLMIAGVYEMWQGNTSWSLLLFAVAWLVLQTTLSEYSNTGETQ